MTRCAGRSRLVAVYTGSGELQDQTREIGRDMTRLSLRRGAVGGIVLLLGLLAVVAVAAPAGALTARFTLDGDATFARSLRVTAGDGGWTPFFRPAVVVWDGGSIIEGHGATTGHEFPAQTLAVLPHAAESYVSSTGGARIADMLVDAPFEVDTHYRANADLDLCVVLAGGADLYHELTAAEVYQSLKLYCAERRAAGFRVVVLSVLPRNDSRMFEPARLAFNAMLRTRGTSSRTASPTSPPTPASETPATTSTVSSTRPTPCIPTMPAAL